MHSGGEVYSEILLEGFEQGIVMLRHILKSGCSYHRRKKGVSEE